MRTLTFSLIVLCSWMTACTTVGRPDTSPDAQNNLTYAVAWKQTAAEYQALYYQGFHLARANLQLALANPPDSGKPLAVISDLDETLLHAHDYWGYLLTTGRDFFDDEAWDTWVAAQQAVPTPGAVEFLQFCVEHNIEVFYVTNRDQGEDTFMLALESLQALQFPYADNEHLTVLRETSNKQSVQDAIRQEFEVVVMLGDNLNDFSRKFYVTDVAEREALLRADKQRFGTEYIVFPNPTDGHWIRAIFGESEPAATAANRAILRSAATREAWLPPQANDG